MADEDPVTDCPFHGEAIRRSEFAGDAQCAAIYNVAPILPGHSLIIPRRHVTRMADLGDGEICHLFVFARRITQFLVAEFGADGFDWSVQDGASAGQTVQHVHLHVIPRWPSDLPEPGDWYRRLYGPFETDGDGMIDSASRKRLSEDEMDRIVRKLRSHAEKRSLVAEPM